MRFALAAQLIVNESQEALFFKGGQALHLFFREPARLPAEIFRFSITFAGSALLRDHSAWRFIGRDNGAPDE